MSVRISDAAVTAATGKDWNEWMSVLRAAEPAAAPHRELAAYLGDAYGLSPWWRQRVALAYEEARGRRVPGSSASAGYEIGARRTLPLTPDEAWSRLTSPAGLAAWLGETPDFRPVAGQAYHTAGGAAGEVRVVKPGSHLRVTWAPANWREPSTIQVRIIPSGPGRTAISFHQENLPDAPSREHQRKHWQAALFALAALDGRPRAAPAAA